MSYKYVYNPIEDAFNLVEEYPSYPISRGHCIFKQTFTGNGSDTQFQLTGTENATFVDDSSWSATRILNILSSYITKTNKGAIYDSLNIFTRNRITVSSISASGLVTLDYVPRDTEQFIIWYWYDLAPNDVIDEYYREDFVNEIEGEKPTLTASDISYNNITKTADYLLINIDYTILADATSNTVTITLPASPTQGQTFIVKCINATYTCTIARNGKNIDGSASDITLGLNESITLQYDSSFGWVII